MIEADARARLPKPPRREIVSLWLEVASARVLMWIANPSGAHRFQPHVHLYLADRYGRLAAAYRGRFHLVKADRLAEIASRHFDLGGGDEPPPAAALAMGSVQRRILVDADRFVSPVQGKLLPFPPRDPSGMPESPSEEARRD